MRSKDRSPRGTRSSFPGFVVARASFFGYSAVTDKIAEAAIADMKAQGAVIVDPANIPNADKYDASELEVLLYEFKADLNKYLGALGRSARVRSLADVIAFNEADRSREMPFFGQDLLTRAQRKGPLTDKAYRDALARNHRLSRTEGIDAVMNRYRLDALIAPTGNPAWTTDLINGDHFIGSSSTPAAVAGYPNVTVPAGSAFGLPVGISFIGRAWRDELVLKLAYAYEQATKHRRPPTFAASAPLQREAGSLNPSGLGARDSEAGDNQRQSALLCRRLPLVTTDLPSAEPRAPTSVSARPRTTLRRQ